MYHVSDNFVELIYDFSQRYSKYFSECHHAVHFQFFVKDSLGKAQIVFHCSSFPVKMYNNFTIFLTELLQILTLQML